MSSELFFEAGGVENWHPCRLHSILILVLYVQAEPEVNDQDFEYEYVVVGLPSTVQSVSRPHTIGVRSSQLSKNQRADLFQ